MMKEMGMNKLLSILCGLLLATPALAGLAAPIGGELRSQGVAADSTQFGIRLGATKVKQISRATGTYGAYIDRAVADNLLLGGTLDYWSKATGSLGRSEAEVSDIALGLDAKFVFTNTRTAFRPYALAGASVHRFTIKEVQGSNDNKINRLDSKYRDNAGKFGLDYGAGVMYRVQTAMDLVGELRYRPIMDPGVDLGQVALSGGMAYSL